LFVFLVLKNTALSKVVPSRQTSQIYKKRKKKGKKRKTLSKKLKVWEIMMFGEKSLPLPIISLDV